METSAAPTLSRAPTFPTRDIEIVALHHASNESPSPTRRVRRRSIAVRITAAVLSCSAAATAQEIVEDGAASWYASVPQGRGVPCDNNGVPVVPNVTADFEGHASTADWCSSIFWERYPGNPYGNPMFPLPLALQASPDGLLLGRPPEATNTAFAFATPFGYDNAPMRITTGGLTGAIGEPRTYGLEVQFDF